MWHLPGFKRLLQTIAALACMASISGCGVGYAEVVVEDEPPPIEPLALVLTRVGPEAIQLDWSDDPHSAWFVVKRDGFTLAKVTTISLIDASVLVDETYCYQVLGFDAWDHLVAASDTACMTLLP